MVDPIRMHLTLGVMSLQSESDGAGSKTVNQALDLLRSLRSELLDGIDHSRSGGLKVPLERMGTFSMGKGQSSVLWVGPRELQEETENPEADTVSTDQLKEKYARERLRAAASKLS
jgi:2'-5' RNA ligase